MKGCATVMRKCPPKSTRVTRSRLFEEVRVFPVGKACVEMRSADKEHLRCTPTTSIQFRSCIRNFGLVDPFETVRVPFS